MKSEWSSMSMKIIPPCIHLMPQTKITFSNKYEHLKVCVHTVRSRRSFVISTQHTAFKGNTCLGHNSNSLMCFRFLPLNWAGSRTDVHHTVYVKAWAGARPWGRWYTWDDHFCTQCGKWVQAEWHGNLHNSVDHGERCTRTQQVQIWACIRD